MPPARKRAPAKPKPDPAQEEVGTPAEAAQEELAPEETTEADAPAASPEPEAAPKDPPAAKDEEADDGWQPAPTAPDSKQSPCRSHFGDGVSDGVTAVACEHGSWVRT